MRLALFIALKHLRVRVRQSLVAVLSVRLAQAQSGGGRSSSRA